MSLYDKTVTITRQTRVDNGAGGAAMQTTAVASNLPASIQGASTATAGNYAVRGMSMSDTIYVKAQPSLVIKPGDRVTYNAEVYVVLGLTRAQNNRLMMGMANFQLHCERRYE